MKARRAETVYLTNESIRYMRDNPCHACKFESVCSILKKHEDPKMCDVYFALKEAYTQLELLRR